MKHVVLAMLLLFMGSCAPKDRVPEPFMEKRVKSSEATRMIRIGGTDGAFFFDPRMWSVKSETATQVDFNARRFANAHILAFAEAMPMTDIHRKLVEHHGLKNAQLLESEFVTVNGEVVIFNKIEGVLGRKAVVMLGYGFSDGRHTFIVHGYAYKSMMRPETEAEIMDFLNGFAPKG